VPVVVTGASGFIGRHAVAALSRVSPQVRAYVRRPDAVEPLRETGAKVALGRIDDLDNLEVVMAGAHTVCHLAGPNAFRSDDDERSTIGSLRSVLEAASRAGVRRVLYLSYPGASPQAANAFLRSKGEAEELIQASGLEHVVVRTTHVYGPGSEWLRTVSRQSLRHPALVLGSGRQVLAPVFVEDVAAVLAAADDRERVESGTRGLEGPDRLTADDLADLLAGGSTRKLHLAPRAVAGMARLAGDSVARVALELMAGDSLADGPDASAEFRVPRTSLREGLARSGLKERE
jgi:uncharacterized protein YbjT (DUF2867 family)